MIDLHCHILPELDDGARDFEESIEMARSAVQDGISGIVCTPHLTPAFPENDRATVLAKVEQLRSRLLQAGIPLELYPGSELGIEWNLPDRIESAEVLSINDERRFVLVEMPVETIPPNLEKFFWNMQSRGIGIVLAHPERNLHLMKHPSILFEWVAGGVMAQVTASALEGAMGRSVRDFAVSLFERRLAHVVATDSHGTSRRKPVLSGARAVVESAVGKEEAYKIFYEHPKQILLGMDPDIEPPVQTARKKPLLKRLFASRR